MNCVLDVARGRMLVAMRKESFYVEKKGKKGGEDKNVTPDG